MEAIKGVGEIVISSDEGIKWKIPNFYDLPQEYNTVIRSPHFRNEDRDWYMEVYPNGRKLYSSLEWFGISILNLNRDSAVVLGIQDADGDNFITTIVESNGDGFYCCTKFLPRLLLKSWKDIFAPGGDLCLCFLTEKGNLCEEMLIMHFILEDVQNWFKDNFEIPSAESFTQVKRENELLLETDVGEISLDSDDDAEWTIPNFWDISLECDTVISSPHFRFKDRDWYLEVYPNGRRWNSSLGWFEISVWNLNSDSIKSSVAIGVSTDNTCRGVLQFEVDLCSNGCYCGTRLFPTSLLNIWKDIVAERGNLHVILNVKDGDTEDEDTEDEDTEDEDDENAVTVLIETKYVQELYQKFENKDTFIEASTQTEGDIENGELEKNYRDANTVKSAEAKKEKGVEKLMKDFREMLLNGSISDIVLKVEGQEFRAHKFILAARSPVFLAMMTHDTKEKSTGVVDIPDVDPTVFHDFLSYLYTGSLDNLTSENAAKLYTAADKYQVNELKENCRDLMLTNISVDNFCDIFTLSLRHNEIELKEACIQFFSEKSLDIVLTCKWQTFLSENPITGNELFIKHLKLSN